MEAAAKEMVPAQVQQDDELLAKEAEESLEEREIKRKREETPVMEKKSKRRKLEKLTGWGEKTEDLENQITLQEEVPTILEVTSAHQEDTSTRQEELETREIQTRKNITKQGSKQKTKQTSMKSWTKNHNSETEAGAEVRKRKRVDEPEKEVKKKAQKFQFNTKGKLTVEEVAELSRTNVNIFSWLKPAKKVLEAIEPAEDVYRTWRW